MPRALLTVVAGLFAAPALALAQGPAADRAPLFASDQPVEVTLRADFDALDGDRRGETPERPAAVELNDQPSFEVSLEAQLRTRGDFRRDPSNCSFPPLRLNLKKNGTTGTVFEGQDKLKIVGSCRPNRESYEQLVLLEYLTYRAFELVTEASFRTRLARITYVDESSDDEPETRFAFFIEDDEALAERLGGAVFELETGKNIPAGYFDPVTQSVTAVFQYMIGNTDWSDVAGHNVDLIERQGLALAVPYDFDFSGLVDAPYAIPDPDLGIKSVRDRMYRGWCQENLNVASVLDRFRAAEADILGLFETFPWLDDGERDRSLRYLRSFFEQIDSDERAERLFLRDCRNYMG